MSCHPLPSLLSDHFKPLLSPSTPEHSLQFPVQGRSCLLVPPHPTSLSQQSLRTCCEFLETSTNPFILIIPDSTEVCQEDSIATFDLQLTVNLGKRSETGRDGGMIVKYPEILCAKSPVLGVASILDLLLVPEDPECTRVSESLTFPEQNPLNAVRALEASGLCSDRVESMLLLSEVKTLSRLKEELPQMDKRARTFLEQNKEYDHK